jgi:cell wall-associated NlpC family hydrolase
MKCKFCEMLNQQPETACTHCGRMLPALPGPMTTTESENDENAESQAESGQAETTQEGQETPESGVEAGAESGDGGGEAVAAEGEAEGNAEQVTPEDGHVDNVGDESEKETVLP